MSKLRTKIHKITEGIGSPFGEGATYKRGSSPSHLDDDEQEELEKDILLLFEKHTREIIGFEIPPHALMCQSHREDLVCDCGTDLAENIQRQQLALLDKLVK